MTYIESELEALEREQEAIDQKASNLEAKLRAVMGGNPSNNQKGTNPFLRLIRNSIGGGDVIRIKLLDSDDESLFGSGVSEDDYDGDENDEVAAHSDNSSNCSDEKHVLRIPHRQRPRAHSCFVNTSENFAMIQPTYQQQQHAHAHRHHHHHQHHDSHGSHQQQQHPHHVHHVEPYEHHLLGNNTASSSNCDNHLNDYYDGANDDDALMVASTGHAAVCSRRQRAMGHRRDQHHQHHRRSRSRGYCGKVVLLRPIKLLTAFAMPANSTSQLKRLTACSPVNLSCVCSFVLLTVILYTIYYIAL